MRLKDGKLLSSYSQINLFEQCPYRWNLRYLQDIKEDIKSKHLEYGIAVHDAHEFFFKEIQQGYTPSLPFLKEYFEYQLSKREIPFDSSEEELEWTMEGLIQLERLYTQPTEFERMMVNSEILGVEKEFLLPVEMEPIEVEFTDESGELNTKFFNMAYIKGFIDLVIKTDDGIVVIDHKSGGKLFKNYKLKNDLQFPIYAMAIQQEYGDIPVKSLYNFTRLHDTQEVNITDIVIKKAKNRIVKVFKKMNNKKFTPKPCPLCYWCDFSKHKLNVCRYSSNWEPKR